MSCTPACHNPTPSQAHCGACHRTLGSVTEFDRHRRGGACIDPQTLGLVEARQVWASPERHASAIRKAEMFTKVRLQRSHTSVEGRTDGNRARAGTGVGNADLPREAGTTRDEDLIMQPIDIAT